MIRGSIKKNGYIVSGRVIVLISVLTKMCADMYSYSQKNTLTHNHSRTRGKVLALILVLMGKYAQCYSYSWKSTRILLHGKIRTLVLIGKYSYLCLIFVL